MSLVMTGGYQTVQRFIGKLRGLSRRKASGIIHTAAGEEAQVISAPAQWCVIVVRSKAGDARRLLETALRAGDGLDTFGTDYLARLTGRFTACLDREGASPIAKKILAKAALRSRVRYASGRASLIPFWMGCIF